MVPALNYLIEDRGSVLRIFCKDLEQVAFVIEVEQNAKLLNSINIFFDLNRRLSQSFAKLVVVDRWDAHELHSPGPHTLDSRNYIVSTESNVLDARPCVVVNVFLNL